MQSGCRFQNIWRVLAVAGTVGAASAALASDPVKTPDQKQVTSSSSVLKAPPTKGTQKVENPKYFVKGPEDNSQPPVLRGVPPANDLCANASVISVPGSVFGDTTGGAPDAEAAACVVSPFAPPDVGLESAGVWYTFTGNGADLQVGVCLGGASFDTVLRVFSGSCGALTCVAGNDDFCGLQSQVTFTSQAGTQYFVYLSAFGAAAAGTYTLDVVDLGVPPPGPANDECADAETLLCNSSIIADNTSATIGATDPFSSCRFGGGQAAGTIWYTFTATETSARVQTCASFAPADDSVLEVFDACGGFSIACSEDDCNGLLSRIDLNNLVVGNSYIVQLGSYLDADRGPYNLELICPLPPMQPGDGCISALDLGGLPASVAGDTSTFEPDAGLPACGAGAAAPSIWYSMVGTGGIIEASLCAGTAYDSAIAVFTGDCAFPTCVANDDDACGIFAGPSRAVFLSQAGQTYYIVVRGFGTSAGPFTLDVSDLGPPGPGDDCSTAQALAVPSTTIGNTCGATPEALACGTGDSSPGLWYSVVGTGNTFLATTCNGTFYDSALSVLSGSCDFPTCVGSNDDTCGLQSQVVFPTVAGETYFIVVRGFSSNCGDFQLDVSEILPPANDECAGAVELFCNTSVNVNNLGATDNFVDDIYLCRIGGGNGVGSVWFRFTATEDSVDIQTCNSVAPADDSILQLFEGTCGGLVPLLDACNDDGCNGLRSRLIVRNLIVGNQYYLMLSSWGAADLGDYTVDFNCPAPPPAPGDDCVDAIDFGAVPGTVGGDTSLAFVDAVDACGGPGAGAPGVWYRVTAPMGATQLRAETCGSAYDTVLRAYNGPCDFLSCIAFNDDRCGLQSSLIWDVVGGTEYLVWVGGFGTSNGVFTLTIDEPPPPCQVVVPGGADMEIEPDCGVPTDTVNGGCNSVPEVFGTIQCNVPFFGSGAFDGFTRDTDWLQFTLSETMDVTLTVETEFPALIGFLETNTPNPTGVCSEYTGFVAPAAFPVGDCISSTVTATLGAGVWTVFVGPQFLDNIACGNGNNEYIATISNCGGEMQDCNNNGIADADEIANGAADCFNPLVVTDPHTSGGADTFLDECQCVANWNRDGAANSNDISAYLTSWLNAVGGGVSADVNCDGANNSNDISAFLSVWLSAVQNTIPHDGCP